VHCGGAARGDGAQAQRRHARDAEARHRAAGRGGTTRKLLRELLFLLSQLDGEVLGVEERFHLI
jgi:hypothetical protein